MQISVHLTYLGRPSRSKIRIVLKEDNAKARASKKYREKIKSLEWLEKQRKRSKDYRASMNEQQRAHYNEKAKERMRKLRERKKLSAEDAQPNKRVMRSEATRKKELRQRKTELQRQYRSKMSGQKKTCHQKQGCCI
jgi:hypothetical protein